MLADGGEFTLFGGSTQLVQQGVAIGKGAAAGRLDERKVFHAPRGTVQVQRLHAQNHSGQRAAQNFGVGELGAAGKAGLVIQPDANAICHAPAAARTLVGCGLADGLHHQLLHLLAQAVALHAGGASIDHKPDAGHRERGFGHVGGQHNAPTAVVVKHAVLLGLAQAGKQGQHLGVAQCGLVAQVFGEVVCRLADFALAGQKNQNVAALPRPATPQLIDAVGNCRVQVGVFAFFKRAVAQLHRKGAARHHDDRRRPLAVGKVVGKTLGVDRGRGDDDLQIGPLGAQLAQKAQQKVDVQAAFVRLVDDECVVRPQQRVGLRLGQQNAVGHELDGCISAQTVLKPHFVAHQVAQRGVQFLGNAFGHAAGRNAARLGVANQLAALPGGGVELSAPHGQGNFG